MTDQCFWFHASYSTAYKAYKRSCGRGSSEADSLTPSLEDGVIEPAKEKEYAVENSAFEFDENGNSEEKGKRIDKNTQLWDYSPANHRLWTVSMNIEGHSTTEDSTALCRPEVCTTGPVLLSIYGRFRKNRGFPHVFSSDKYIVLFYLDLYYINMWGSLFHLVLYNYLIQLDPCIYFLKVTSTCYINNSNWMLNTIYVYFQMQMIGKLNINML